MKMFKAVRLDGTDFYAGTIRYDVGTTVTHPNPHARDASGYLSVSTSPTDCTGMEWPCRLLVVEPVGAAWTPEPDALPNKRAMHSLCVVEERPAHEALGPHGAAIAALIDRVRAMTPDEVKALVAAWHAAGHAAWDAAWVAARDAARAAAWGLVILDLAPDAARTLLDPVVQVLGLDWCPAGARALIEATR
jgi:hypothetical protein